MADSDKSRQPATGGTTPGRSRKRTPATRPKTSGTRPAKTTAGGTARQKKTTKKTVAKPVAGGRTAGVEEHAAKAAPSTPTTTRSTPQAVTADERRRMIAEAAYLKAARRDFAGGDPRSDWLEAESEVDALLLRGERRSGD